MDNFQIVYSGWDPKEQKLREALCTLGNGYFATRGAAEESKDSKNNYPGTYLAGGYNRAKSTIADKEIENEDLVNFPNWPYLNFRPENGSWLNLDDCEVQDYRQVLDMKSGILSRSFIIKDSEDRSSKIESRRLVSMKDMHNAALEWTLTPLNWSGPVEIVSKLDGDLTNNGVERYRDLESRHLDVLSTEELKDGILLTVQTKQSKLVMAQASRTTIFEGDQKLDAEAKTINDKNSIAQHYFLDAKEGISIKAEKIVAIYTSRDKGISEPALDAVENIAVAPTFEQLLKRHRQVWDKLWTQADIRLDNGAKTQQLARLHVFHILQTASPNSVGLDVGIPARGWHGEAYRGHIFWDELFISPFYNLRFPDIAKSLLMYRYHRLEKSRQAAQEAGLKGALFPWQSGSNGREESQKIHLNPQSGNWLPDHTYLQYHVNAAIAYNIWNYYKATGDHQFLYSFGAEMFLSIASFWASKAEFDTDKGRYVLLKVVGPDEYHTSYPDSDQQGLKNNAYTNVFAAWVLQMALDILDLLEKPTQETVLEHLEIDQDELLLWKEVGTKMYVPFLGEEIISQFEGYEDLKEFPWAQYREKHGNIQRLDRLMEQDGDSINHYKASKQADVLMLFYLFSESEIKEIFGKLSYPFTENMVRKNIAYYMDRTSHGSTLSRLVFSWILAKYDKEASWKNFEELLISDFEDIQGGTTPEGIHLGAMAGSLDLIQRCFCGIEVLPDMLWVTPKLLKPFRQIAFKIKYKGNWLSFLFSPELLRITFEEGPSDSIKIGINDRVIEFSKDEVQEFPLGK